MKQIFLIVVVLPIIFFSGCIKAPETIKDIRELKQDHLFYCDSVASNQKITKLTQKKMDDRYNALHFAPWHQSGPAIPVDEIAQPFTQYEKNPGYGENGRKHESSWVNSLRAYSQLNHYPNAVFAAITIENADLRLLPTHKPIFKSFRDMPFDRLQASLIAANTPLFVSHVTRDKAWVLAETPYATGWIQSRNIASVDSGFIKTWEKGRYVVVIKDKMPLYDEGGQFLFHASLGSIFPEWEENAQGFKMLVAVADMNKKAVTRTISVSKEAAVSKPLALTSFNLAKVANELINEPYGWGGLYQNRDCSAMIRDMFAPFGLWLPRHSEDQAREGGAFIDLQNLSLEEKEQMILKQGIPYLSLLWREGHIMLYMGTYQGKILVFHNFWGVGPKGWIGRKERKIVGHAAITTLQPGIELYETDANEENYLNTVLGMTQLIKP